MKLPDLSPAQKGALKTLLEVAPRSSLTLLNCDSGRGRTTILRAAHSVVGGALLGARELMDHLEQTDPFAVEETFFRLVFRELGRHDVVIVDDVHLLSNVLTGRCGMYPRPMLVLLAYSALQAFAAERGSHLVFGSDPHAFVGDARAYARVGVADFTADDFRVIGMAHLGPEHEGDVDFARVHRFAPRLTARQLRSACEALRPLEPLDTEMFLEHLRANEMASNVDLAEVQDVDLRDLKGMEDVIQAIEANILLPLEHPELASELGLKPKRGILLAGPPGTGKTTIGRALAHRIRSKFFLVDGTVIAGTTAFYHQIAHIFQTAAENAPSIIFVDDSDVIFESGTELGLYRYLLTKLDGLESQSAGQVCVVLTAMDVGGIPPALLRSGRIELWLETRLPDEAARVEILEDLRATLPAALGDVSPKLLAAAAEGLSGADLRRVVDDGKLLYAYDRARRNPERPVIDYFLDAVANVRVNKQRYAEAEARARATRPQRPPYFDAAMSMGNGFMGLTVEAEESI